MAELVDALVSNTNGAIRAGSIPAPGTQREVRKNFSFFLWLAGGAGVLLLSARRSSARCVRGEGE